MIKKFLTNSKNVERSSYIWNMAGSLIMAFQSVIMLMILTRTAGLNASGIFTIAYANANLFLTIGKYGMRNFQVSDIRNKYSFSDYRNSRLVSTAAMILVSLLYLFYVSKENGYSTEKSLIILWMCLFKVPDAFEDVYYGEYQRNARLDIASKAMTIRVAFTIILFGILLIITGQLLFSLIIATIFTYILMVYLLVATRESLHLARNNGKGKTYILLKECFPLFAGSFLSFYIGNAPKYAIDATLSDELQACYGFIAMPVFVIGLLNGFVFNPMLYKISRMWQEREIGKFLKNVLFQILVVAVITIICLVGAYLLGIPVLSVLYNTDLSEFKTELLVLLFGGGLLGLSGLLSAVITIMRMQNWLLGGYLIVAVFALLGSRYFVGKYAVMGAAVEYAVLMLILCVCFAGILTVGILRARGKEQL